MNRSILFLALFFFGGKACFAQHLSTSEKRVLLQKEDSLKLIAPQIIHGRNPEDRFMADSQFTKIFVRALQMKNSFYYPFDSLVTIAKVIPADSTFRIFTWQLVINGEIIRQHGAIQMRTSDGSLKLFPLIDKSDLIQNINDTITSNLAWIGAIYYKIIEKKSFGKNYYTLLGFDDNNLVSDRKIIEPLTFRDGKPVFGGPFFSFQDNGVHPKSLARYILEYKKEAAPRLNYDNNMDIIIYEHLISETGEPQKKYTYIPDGDYEGLKWKDGKWVHIEKIFNQVTPEGKPPTPSPILDEKGNIDESKLSKRAPQVDSIPKKDDNNPMDPF
ncbi:MAG: hypothetical protein ABI237_15760 [Ginsengibacter sp.]